MESAKLAEAARRKTKQVAKAKLDLEISANMKIGVCMYIKSKIVSLPTVKKRDSKHNSAVRIDRSYVRIDEPDIAVDSKLTALRYGGEYVPITEADVESMKLPHQGKCLKVIGFFDKSIFPMHRLISNADCVAAESGKAHAAIALSSLIHALLEEGKVALCRLSVRDNSDPKLVCLFPHADPNFECFYAVQVPFAEDSRENSLLFPSLPEAGADLLEQIDALIDARIMPDDNKTLVPELTVNPTLYRFWKTVEGRAETGDDSFIAPIDAVVSEIVNPERNLANIEDIAKKIQSHLKEVEGESAETKQKKKYWRELHHEPLLESPRKNIDVKKIRVESTQETNFFESNNVSSNLKSFLSSQLSTQDTQNHPVPSDLKNDIGEILQLLEAGHPSKAANGVKSFREKCENQQLPEIFNEFLQSLVGLAEKHPRMWRELIGAGVSLITKDEVKSAKPTLGDAHLLLEKVMKMI